MEVPDDVVFVQLLALPIQEILIYCQTNRQINRVCQGEYLWRLLIERDFPQQFATLGTGSARELYLSSYIGPVTFYYHDLPMGRILMSIPGLSTYVPGSLTHPFIAFYLDETGQYLGYQVQEGIDTTLTPEQLRRIREIRVYSARFVHPRYGAAIPDAIAAGVAALGEPRHPDPRASRTIDLMARDLLRPEN